MISKSYLVAAFVFMLSFSCRAQVPEVIREVLVAIADDLPEDIDLFEWGERLAFYLDEPIDLNRTDGRELRELLIFSVAEIEAILEHRKATGGFIELFELQSVEGLSLSKARLAIPFLTARGNIPGRGATRKWQHELIGRYGRTLQAQAGYANDNAASSYLGSPDKVLFRYKLQAGRLAALSLSLAKDAGERFDVPHLNRSNISTGSVNLTPNGFINRIVIGNYSLQVGQGLGIWTGMAIGKGGSALSVPRWGIGLRPASGTSQVMSLKGLAASFRSSHFSVCPFFSSVRKDASFTVNPLTGNAEVRSFSETGLYRTVNEVSKRARLRQQVTGVITQYEDRRMACGILASSTAFDHKFAKADELYRTFDFDGKSLINASVFYRWVVPNATFFGEHAVNVKKGRADLHGLIASLSRDLAFVFVYRNVSKKYQSFFKQDFSNSSAAEKGVYVGASYRPNSRVTVDFFADRFYSPWLRYRINAPSRGSELGGSLTATMGSGSSVKLLARSRLREENTQELVLLPFPVDQLKANARVDFALPLNRSLEFLSRIEKSWYRKEGAVSETGLLVYQEVRYESAKSPFSGSLRVSIFDTDSYNSRIYAYESDVLYASSNPAFFDQGSKVLLNAKVRMGRRISLWCRFARMVYLDRESIGSEGDEILGPLKSDIRLQLRLAL